jgi:hypothetical protein
MGSTPPYGAPTPRIPPSLLSECQFWGDPLPYRGVFYFIEHDPLDKITYFNEKNFLEKFTKIGVLFILGIWKFHKRVIDER